MNKSKTTPNVKIDANIEKAIKQKIRLEFDKRMTQFDAKFAKLTTMTAKAFDFFSSNLYKSDFSSSLTKNPSSFGSIQPRLIKNVSTMLARFSKCR